MLADLLPDALQEWFAEETIPLNTPNDMYTYMDGGAELYLSYGFKQAISRKYRKINQPEVTAEVYDLIESRNAFGVFSQTRETENLQLGQGAFSLPGAVFFWKDHYYISLSTWESTPGSEDFIRRLGAFIDEKIKINGELPPVIKLLPEEGLVPFGYLYFHHYVWLNAYFFITDSNLLRIDDQTDAVIAKYTVDEKRMFLILVQYGDNAAAREAFSSFGSAFFPEGLTDNCLRLEDNNWLAAAVSDRMIAAVFNGTTGQSANRLLMKALEKYKAI
jgi:hypothetical protein